MESSDSFQEAEESAQQLLASLQSLKEEAVSYKTSTMELEAVRERLIDLIGSTEKAAGGMNDVIEAIRANSGPEIMNQLGQSMTKLEKLEEFITTRFRKLRTLVLIAIGTASLAFIIGIISLVK